MASHSLGRADWEGLIPRLGEMYIDEKRTAAEIRIILSKEGKHVSEKQIRYYLRKGGYEKRPAHLRSSAPSTKGSPVSKDRILRSERPETDSVPYNHDNRTETLHRVPENNADVGSPFAPIHSQSGDNSEKPFDQFYDLIVSPQHGPGTEPTDGSPCRSLQSPPANTGGTASRELDGRKEPSQQWSEIRFDGGTTFHPDWFRQAGTDMTAFSWAEDDVEAFQSGPERTPDERSKNGS
ncbi:MAG: hypothetical protein M1837_001943 [Sclerophora amabilis]|nr:MAG: hypothetical protein M1837_001943 [Sclerophora amabilis]